jgi:hypothetical protein
MGGTRSRPHNPTGSWRAGCCGSCTSDSTTHSRSTTRHAVILADDLGDHRVFQCPLRRMALALHIEPRVGHFQHTTSNVDGHPLSGGMRPCVDQMLPTPGVIVCCVAPRSAGNVRTLRPVSSRPRTLRRNSGGIPRTQMIRALDRRERGQDPRRPSRQRGKYWS